MYLQAKAKEFHQVKDKGIPHKELLKNKAQIRKIFKFLRALSLDKHNKITIIVKYNRI